MASKYQWPASALGEPEMAILFDLRKKTWSADKSNTGENRKRESRGGECIDEQRKAT